MAFSGNLFETFCSEYQDLLGSDDRSLSMVDDLQYAIELQKKRLESKGLRMECEITPRGHFRMVRSQENGLTECSAAIWISDPATGKEGYSRAQKRCFRTARIKCSIPLLLI